MEILTEKEVIEKRYTVNFDDGHHNGFVFPSDSKGNPQFENDGQRYNYKRCMEHPEEYLRWNVVDERVKITGGENYGYCDKCGNRIEVRNQYYGTFMCPHCRKWYNLFGQQVKNPEDWGKDGIDVVDPEEYY